MTTRNASNSMHRLALLPLVVTVALAVGLFGGCGGGDQTPTFPELEDSPADSAQAAEDGSGGSSALPKRDEPPPPATTPARLDEAVAVIDLRQLSPEEGATQVALSPTSASYLVQHSVDEALERAKRQLIELGAEEVQSSSGESPSDAGVRSFAAASAEFKRGDYRLVANVTRSADSPGAEVSIRNFGNVDPRTVPPIEGAEARLASPSMVIYMVSVSLDDAVAACRKALASAGWREFVATSSLDLDSHRLTLTFKQNAIELHVFIGGAAEPGWTAIQYSTSLLNHEFPAPAGATDLQFSDLRGIQIFRTEERLAEVADFYRRELGERGWTLRSDSTSEGREWVVLAFDDAEREAVLLVELSEAAGDRTEAQVRQVDAAAYAKSEAVRPADEAPLEMPADASAPRVSLVVVAGRDLPLPVGARDVGIDPASGSLHYTTGLSIAELMKLMVGGLKSSGWTHEEGLDVVSDSGASTEFVKGEASIGLRILKLGATVEVTLTGEGVEWRIADAGPAPSPLDRPADEERSELPVPDDRVGYSSSKAEFRNTVLASSPSSLSTLIAFYRDALAQLDWQVDDDKSQVENDRATLYFTSPRGTAVLHLERADGATRISLVERRTDAARAAGLLPEAGRARVVFTNRSGKAARVTIGEQTVELAAGEGEEPARAPSVDLAAGKHEIRSTVDGVNQRPEQTTFGPDETWQVIVLEVGPLAKQIY